MNKPNTKLLQEILRQGRRAEQDSVPEFVPPGSPFDEAQRAYLNGLFAGLYTAAKKPPAAGGGEAQTPLAVYFGSQTGTAESLSKDLRRFSREQGFDATVAELDAVTPEALADIEHLLIVAATYGDGEPTDNASAFHAALMAEDAATLPATLNFSVCGLGDSSYPHFNRVARELDERLEALGATRVAPLVTCDVDYDEDYAAWREAVFSAPAFAEAAGAASSAAADDDSTASAFDRNRPFIASLMSRRCLNSAGSAKRVNHIELSLAGGGDDLAYEVGDALGVWPLNDMAAVDALVSAAGLDGAETVETKNGCCSLRQALYRSFDLTTVSPKTAEAWGLDSGSDTHLIDALSRLSAPLTAQALTDGLRPLQARLYSISSSPKKNPGEVHLTVGEVRYEHNGQARQGVASTFLGERLAIGAAVGVYIHRAPHFSIPEDDGLPLIMIGPGTGVAPFRAFLEEREARGAQGSNWLFFGDQHERCDFLYREELQAWQDTGLLDRLDLAWSRDGSEKVYVQHLIEREGEDVFDWLKQGAAIYVCGDASRMAADVETALLKVISRHGEMSAEHAQEYLGELKKAHRYQRDVY